MSDADPSLPGEVALHLLRERIAEDPFLAEHIRHAALSDLADGEPGDFASLRAALEEGAP